MKPYGANIPCTRRAPESCANAEAKALLHASEIERIGQEQAMGYTIVPLAYFIGGRAKVEIALAKGKQEWDRRRLA